MTQHPQHAPFAVDKTLVEVDTQLGSTGTDFPHDPADTPERTFREVHDITWLIFGKPHAANVIEINDLSA